MWGVVGEFWQVGRINIVPTPLQHFNWTVDGCSECCILNHFCLFLLWQKYSSHKRIFVSNVDTWTLSLYWQCVGDKIYFKRSFVFTTLHTSQIIYLTLLSVISQQRYLYSGLDSNSFNVLGTVHGSNSFSPSNEEPCSLTQEKIMLKPIVVRLMKELKWISKFIYASSWFRHYHLLWTTALAPGPSIGIASD